MLLSSISKLIHLSIALSAGIITGILTAERCCVEYRPQLGWVVGIATSMMLWSLIYTLCSESHFGR